MSAGSGNADKIEERAAIWAIRADEGPLDSAAQSDLDAWLAEDSRHLGAFVRAQAQWLDIDRVAALDSGSRAESAAAPAEPRRRWQRYAIAASIAVAALGGGIGYDRLAGRIATDRGEVREIALEDGSKVFLNGDSVIQVRFDDGERRIVLRKGEASFKVAHNAQRPFIVSARDVDVKAVGTEFVVGLAQGDVAVTVEEGIVAVDGKGDGLAKPRYLRRNEELVAASTGVRKAVLDTAEVERRSAWRKGLLVFSGQPLGAAAGEVNRYSDIRVIIDDPTLARAEFLGVFRIGDARAFAGAAAHAFNGEVREAPGELRIVRQANSPSH